MVRHLGRAVSGGGVDDDTRADERNGVARRHEE
jgi:hypothetical protein